jgi:hypothetical protein
MAHQVLGCGDVQSICHDEILPRFRWLTKGVIGSCGVRSLVIACLSLTTLLGSARAASIDLTISGFALPSRSADPKVLGDRALQVAGLVAERLGGHVARSERPLDLAARIKKGRQLIYTGAIDEAMAVLDSALDDAAKMPHRIAREDAGDLIAAHFVRATIAVAKGEVARARTLLQRLLQDDPSVELQPSEKNPQVQAALTDLRRQSSAPSIEESTLGDACKGAEVVIVARASTRTSAEIVRFDRNGASCRRVAQITVSLSTTDEDPRAADALAKSPPARLAAVGAERSSRTKLIVGAVLLAAGVAIAATGIYFAVDADHKLSNIGTSCTASAPCMPPNVNSLDDAYHRSTIAASVLVPVGVAALVAGGVLTALGAKHRQLTVAGGPIPGGALLAWGGAF